MYVYVYIYVYIYIHIHIIIIIMIMLLYCEHWTIQAIPIQYNPICSTSDCSWLFNKSAGLPACLIGKCCSCPVLGLCLFLCSLATSNCFVWMVSTPPPPASSPGYSSSGAIIGCSTDSSTSTNYYCCCGCLLLLLLLLLLRLVLLLVLILLHSFPLPQVLNCSCWYPMTL